MERFGIATGATGPVGRQVAEVLLERGFSVVASGTPSHALEATVEELRGQDGELLGVPGHVAGPEHRRELVDWIYEMNEGRLDVLVNYEPPPDREWPPSMLWRWVGLLAPELAEHRVGVVFVDSGEERRGPRHLRIPDRPEAPPLSSWAWLFDQDPLEVTGRSFLAPGR